MAEFNKRSCAQNSEANTGRPDNACDLKMGNPRILYITGSRVEIPLAGLTNDSFLEQVARREIYVIQNVDSHTNAPEGAVTNTSNTGKTTKGRDGLMSQTFNIDSSHANYNEILKLNDRSQGVWNLVVADDANALWGTKVGNASEGEAVNLRGVNLSYFNAEISSPDGGVTEQLTITVQYDSLKEFEGQSPLYNETHGLDLRELNGVIPANLEVPVAPSASDVTIRVAVAYAGDNDTAIPGLLPANFRVTEGSNTIVPSAVSQVAGQPLLYDLTVPAVISGQSYSISLFDSVNNINVIKDDLDLYTSNIAVTEVA